MTGHGKQQGGPTPSSSGTISQKNFKRISWREKHIIEVISELTMMKIMAMISMMMFMVMVMMMMMKIWLD